MSNSVADDQLRAFIERIERMNEERRAIADDIKEIYAEAKGNGFNTKALKIIIRQREQDYAERMELEAIVDLYKAALGMVDAPLYDDGDDPRAPAPARAREIIEEFPADEASTEADKTRGGLPVAAASGTAEETGRTPAYTRTGGPGTPPVPGVTAGETAPMQEGSEPIEAHNLDRAGSTPAPATTDPIIPFAHPDDGRPRSSTGLPRPVGCQHLDACARTWRDTEPCSLCRQTITVEPGGVDTDHHGVVA